MSWQCNLINLAMRFSKWHLSGKDFHQAKAAMIRMADERAARAAPPKGAIVEKVRIADVNCEWVYARQDSSYDTEKVIMYFHGGGFFAGSPDTHRDAAFRLSEASGMKTLVVDYSLTPDAVFPVALDQSVAVYQWLLANGFQASDIAFGGDSAGGNMTLAVMKRLQQKQLSLPFAGFCISPWADLTHSGESWQSNRRADVMIPPNLLENAAVVYANGEPAEDPLISPVFADMHGLPPLYVIAGATEILVDDANRIAQQAQDCGVKVEKKIWPKVPHAFTSMASFLPEGRQAIEDIAAFLNRAYQQVEQ